MRSYTGTVDRVIVFVTEAQRVAANGIYASSDFDSGGNKTFDLATRCSADGQEPATHLMVNHVVDQQFRDGVLNGVGNAPFFDVYKQSEGWNKESALIDMGLTVINTGL